MKLFSIILILASSSPVYAGQVDQRRYFVSNEIAHGGGCRKSSPRGQCCHAGSKPLHCHK